MWIRPSRYPGLQPNLYFFVSPPAAPYGATIDVNGGIPPKDINRLRSQNPKLLVVGHGRRDMREIFRAFKATTRLPGEHGGFKLVPLIAAGDEKRLCPVIDQYYTTEKTTRREPLLTP